MLPLPAPLREAVEARGAGLTILVVRLGAMGDIVRTFPAVRLVRRGLPDARIHWIAWEPWSTLLTDHPDLDSALGLPRGRMRRLARSPLGWPALANAVWNAAGGVRALSAGLVLDFHGDLRSGLVGVVSGAPVRLGYEGHQQKEGNRLLTTHRVPAGERRRSRIERNLDLVRALGLADSPLPDAGISIRPEDAAEASAIVRAIDPPEGAYAVINPGASRRQAYKKPPAPLLAAAARAIADRGIAPLVVSGPGEEDDARKVIEASRGCGRPAPPTSIKALAALLGGARLFVGGDSGPLHLACGVGCPVVGLYGPTDPIVNGPWNVPSATLAPSGAVYTGIKREDREANGFAGLSEDAVVRAIGEVLAITPKAR